MNGYVVLNQFKDNSMIKLSSCIFLALSASILLFSSAFAQIPVLGIDFGDGGVTPSEQGGCGSSVVRPGTGFRQRQTVRANNGFIQTIEIASSADGGGVLLWPIMFLLLWQTRNYLSS
ncbi:MAG: hypothetical protein GXP14_09095 [Gammaproteobacteria bacterium]|nr:hypothetical protein [Gammaproteobacteria bacterium]